MLPTGLLRIGEQPKSKADPHALAGRARDHAVRTTRSYHCRYIPPVTKFQR